MKKFLGISLVILIGIISLSLRSVEAFDIDIDECYHYENLIENGDFSDSDISDWSDNWSNNAYYSAGELFYNVGDGLRTYPYFNYDTYVFEDHIYYYSVDLRSVDGNATQLRVGDGIYSDVYTNNLSVLTTYNNVFLGTISRTFQLQHIYNTEAEALDSVIEVDNVMLFDLTEIYGSGNEPTIEEVESYLENAPNYFDDYTNITCLDNLDTFEYIGYRELDNLIINGDFINNYDYWNIFSASGVVSDETLILDGFGASSNIYMAQSNVIDNINNIYYLSYDLYTDTVLQTARVKIAGGTQFSIVEPNINEWVRISGLSNHTAIGTFEPYFYFYSTAEQDTAIIKLDNIIVYDLTRMFGVGYEPTLEEFELLLENNQFLDTDLSDNYFVEDTCEAYYLGQDDIFNYATDIGYRPDLSIVSTVKVYQTDMFDLSNWNDYGGCYPILYTEKYDLEGNLVGVIDMDDDYLLEYSDNNLNNYNDYEPFSNYAYDVILPTIYTYEYDGINFYLPPPAVNEDGYIYVIKNGINGKVFSSGVIFNEPSDSFETAFNDVRSINNAVGINGSIYTDIDTDYQFDNENVDDYVINDYFILHYRDDKLYLDPSLIFFNEVNAEVIEVDLTLLDGITEGNLINYNEYCSGSCEDRDFANATNGDFIYLSVGNVIPPFYNMINLMDTDNILLDNLYDKYLINFINILPESGVYTYQIYDNFNLEIDAIGETPLFYTDDMPTIDLGNHSVREGRNLVVQLNRESEDLYDVYDYQYIYDNNMTVSFFDELETFSIYTEILIPTHSGINNDDATVFYYWINNDAYINGAIVGAYDFALTTSYELRTVEPVDIAVSNWLDVVNLNNTTGKLIIASIIIVGVSIALLVVGASYIIILISVFATIGILSIVGLIPVWIVLFLVIILTAGLFISNTSRGGS